MFPHVCWLVRGFPFLQHRVSTRLERVLIEVDFLALRHPVVVLLHLVPHLRGQLLLGWSGRALVFFIVPPRGSTTVLQLMDEARVMADHWVNSMFLALDRHSKLFTELPCDLPDFLALFFLLEFELSAHLVHRIADNSVLDETTLLVLPHLIKFVICRLY